MARFVLWECYIVSKTQRGVRMDKNILLLDLPICIRSCTVKIEGVWVTALNKQIYNDVNIEVDKVPISSNQAN